MTRYAGVAKAAVRDLGVGHEEAAADILRDCRRRRRARHVANRLAALADEVVVGFGDVGVIPLGTFGDFHEAELAHRHELVQCVVDGRPTDLGQPLLCKVVNLLRREMNMLTDEHLGNGPPLRAQSPVTVAQSHQELCHVGENSS